MQFILSESEYNNLVPKEEAAELEKLSEELMKAAMGPELFPRCPIYGERNSISKFDYPCQVCPIHNDLSSKVSVKICDPTVRILPK